MDVDRNQGTTVTELKIKGQAAVERRRNKWDDEKTSDVRTPILLAGSMKTDLRPLPGYESIKIGTREKSERVD